MTISSQVKQTSASLKGVQATLEMFATIEEDPGCKELLKRNCLKISNVTKSKKVNREDNLFPTILVKNMAKTKKPAERSKIFSHSGIRVAPLSPYSYL